jgi:hypothetical protein
VLWQIEHSNSNTDKIRIATKKYSCKNECEGHYSFVSIYKFFMSIEKKYTTGEKLK